jgi:hypothetical protein
MVVKTYRWHFLFHDKTDSVPEHTSDLKNEGMKTAGKMSRDMWNNAMILN